MKIVRFISLVKDFRSNNFPDLSKIEKMGLLGVRIAQEYSRRIDILSEEMCYYLMDIHSSLLDIEPKHLISMCPKDPTLYNILEYFDNEPFISTYTTQIFKGCMKNGTDVSIKIIDSRGKITFLKDVNSLSKKKKLISFFYSKLTSEFKTSKIIENIEKSTLLKLDFKNEIEYTKFLENAKIENSQKYDFSTLFFPTLFEKYSCDKYLIGEYILGHTVKELLDEKKMKYINVLNIIKYHFFYIFVLGKFHADLSAGNIIVDEDRNIYFIDCNVIAEINDEFRKNFYKFLLNLVRKDYETSMNYLLLTSFDNISLENKNEFLKEFINILSPIENKHLKEINISKKIMSMLKCAINYNLNFPEDLYQTLKAFTRLEEIASRTNPMAVFGDNLKIILELYENDERLK